MPPTPLSERLRLKLVERVRGVFNDVESGQQPVPTSDEALFPKDSPIRMVHADIVANRDNRLMEMFTTVAVVYFVICLLGTLFVYRLQRKFANE